MEKSNRIPMIYGYSVCLVAIITLLISIPNMVNSIIDLFDPIHAGVPYSSRPSASLASFETYKMDILSQSLESNKAAQPGYIPDDQTLRAMFDAAKADRIASAVHIARRTIIVFGLLAVISIVLFIIHFRWMRSISRAT